MKVKIVTPYGIVYDRESDFISFRTLEGSMGILPRRAPIVAQLSVCDVKIKSGDDEYRLKVAGGFLLCDGKDVIIITEEAGREEDISPDRFMEARERVERVRRFFQSSL